MFEGFVPLAGFSHEVGLPDEVDRLPRTVAHPPGKLERLFDKDADVCVTVVLGHESAEVVVRAERRRRELVVERHFQGVLDEYGRLLVPALELQQDRFRAQSLRELLGKPQRLGEPERELEPRRGQVVGSAEQMEAS